MLTLFLSVFCIPRQDPSDPLLVYWEKSPANPVIELAPADVPPQLFRDPTSVRALGSGREPRSSISVPTSISEPSELSSKHVLINQCERSSITVELASTFGALSHLRAPRIIPIDSVINSK